MKNCNIDSPITLTSEELILLNSYRKLNNEGKNVALQRAVELTQITAYTAIIVPLIVF